MATTAEKIARKEARILRYEKALDKALKAQEFRAGDMSAKLASVEVLQKQIDKLYSDISELDGSKPTVRKATFSNWNS